MSIIDQNSGMEPVVWSYTTSTNLGVHTNYLECYLTFNSNYLSMYEAALLMNVSVGTLAVTVWHRPSPRAWADPPTIRTRTLMIKVYHLIYLCIALSFSNVLFFLFPLSPSMRVSHISMASIFLTSYKQIKANLKKWFLGAPGNPSKHQWRFNLFLI